MGVVRGAVLAVLYLMGPALAESRVVSGAAHAINADILRIGNDRVVLWGIDAPEPNQPCSVDGRHWGCYEAALRTLQILAGPGPVSCLVTDHTDPFKRLYAVCETGGVDINAEMVRRGMALAYADETDAYSDIQLEAIAGGVGLWQPRVQFEAPWDWREFQNPGGYK